MLIAMIHLHFRAALLLAVDFTTLSRGLSIAVVGLVIVYTALVLISLFIAGLPRILARLAEFWPERDEGRVATTDSMSDEHELRVLAAIGFVLHSELQRQLSSGSSPDVRQDG